MVKASAWDGGSPCIVFAKRVSPVLQVAVCPVFFFPSLANLQCFVDSYFSKNNVPARLESTGKSGDAEPMWVGLVGPCAGGFLDGVGCEGLPERAS